MRTRSKKVRGKKRRLRNIEKFVPKGMYCYGYRSDGKYVDCPFRAINKRKHHQENGICTTFKLRDEDNFGWIWDWVKECDINDEVEL